MNWIRSVLLSLTLCVGLVLFGAVVALQAAVAAPLAGLGHAHSATANTPKG